MTRHTSHKYKYITNSYNIPFSCRPSWSQGLLSSTHIICRLTITWLLRSLAMFLSSDRIALAFDVNTKQRTATKHTNLDIFLLDLTRFFLDFLPSATCFPFDGYCTTDEGHFRVCVFWFCTCVWLCRQNISAKGFFFWCIYFLFVR